jgi:hypothetical protein
LVSARQLALRAATTGKVDVGLGDPIDVVRPGIECDVERDLDDLWIVVSGRFDGTEAVLADMAALVLDLDGETHRGIRPP